MNQGANPKAFMGQKTNFMGQTDVVASHWDI
jgi:hypothetical protein